MNPDAERPVFGLLHPGQLGAAFGARLAQAGCRVLTATADRSAATCARAREAGFEDVGDLQTLVARSRFVLSFVWPDASHEVAADVARCRAGREGDLTFVDFNSIAPEQARSLSTMLGARGIDYVDGGIHGQPGDLGGRTAVYLSGPAAGELAGILRGHFLVHDLGADPAAASWLKTVLAALSKSLVATFVEAGVLARSVGLLDAFLEQAGCFYPGVLEAVERMGPTYPRHAVRRVQELSSIERSMESRELQPRIVQATRAFLEDLAQAGLPSVPNSSMDWTLRLLIEALSAAGVFQKKSGRTPDQ